MQCLSLSSPPPCQQRQPLVLLERAEFHFQVVKGDDLLPSSPGAVSLSFFPSALIHTWRSKSKPQCAARREVFCPTLSIDGKWGVSNLEPVP